MTDIALLTEARYLQPDLHDPYQCQIALEEALLAQALRRLGLSVQRLAWDDAQQDWSRVRAAVLRSTWDYVARQQQFEDWLDQVARQTLLVNRYDLLRWNLDKHYLRDLAEQDVAIVPTLFLERGQQVDLSALTQRFGWDDLIIKPAVGAGASGLLRVRPGEHDAAQASLQQSLQQKAMLLQPFMHSVAQQGEISLCVIGGQVTHAVRKTPKPGDFRVQDDHGGSVHPYWAEPEEIRFAEQAVAACAVLPQYARVDLVRDPAGRLRLMELELIEPELFLRFNPQAASLLAAEIATIF